MNCVAVILHAVTQVQIKFKEMILSRMLSVVMKVTVVEVDNNLKNRSLLTEWRKQLQSLYLSKRALIDKVKRLKERRKGLISRHEVQKGIRLAVEIRIISFQSVNKTQLNLQLMASPKN